MQEKNCSIELRNIVKKFGSIVANNKVNLKINSGEILCILGENGSGKTTLMNMLSGIYQPDEGEILKNGEVITIRSPRDAYSYGIGMVHQHYHLVDVFTAGENIILGQQNEKMNLDNVNEKVKGICDKYGFDIDPKKKVYNMSVSQKQTIEIVKQLYRGAEILILDEPTAVLTPQETEKLFKVIKNMKADNKAIVLITHKLAEVMSVSDKVAIMRKGVYIDTVETSKTSPQELTDMMVGRKVSLNINRPKYAKPVDKLIVENLTVKDGDGIVKLDNVSFTAKAGEILGVAGITGAGMKELLEAITGLCKVSSGSIRFVNYKNDNEDGEADALGEEASSNGKGGLNGEAGFNEEAGLGRDTNGSSKNEILSETELVGKTPMQIRKIGVGMGFVPEDRLGMGLVGSMGMTYNMMLRSWRNGKGVFFKKRPPEELAKKVWNELEVVTPSITFPVRKMSGGNIQKVLVGRELASSPPVLLTAYAVRGLDINTSYTIYNLLTEEKMKGSAVMYVGEELDVLLELCDRILVLCGGVVSGIVDARSTTKDELGLMMTSVSNSNSNSKSSLEESVNLSSANSSKENIGTEIEEDITSEIKEDMKSEIKEDMKSEKLLKGERK